MHNSTHTSYIDHSTATTQLLFPVQPATLSETDTPPYVQVPDLPTQNLSNPPYLPIPDLPTQDLPYPDLLTSQRKNKNGRQKKALLSLLILILTTAGFLSIYYQLELPKVDQYMHEFVPQDTRIYDRNNVLLYDAYDPSVNGRRVSVKLRDIPKVMQDAMTATEDKTFWTNSGINIVSIVRAVLTNDGGGSTISQQLIKNLSHQDQHTFTRKFREAVLAIGLTQKYTKAQILEMYFNFVSFGAFDFGVETASEEFFHLKSTCPENGPCIPGITRLEYNDKGQYDPILGLARASLLAGIPNAPGILDPTLGPHAKQLALARQKIVLQAMLANHMSLDGRVITLSMVKRAENVIAHTDFKTYADVKHAPQSVNCIITQLAFKMGKGNYSAGLRMFEQGGFTIHTTIDSARSN